MRQDTDRRTDRGSPLFRRHVLRKHPRVLLAEDDPRFRQLIATALRHDGFEVVEVRDGGGLLGTIASRLLLDGAEREAHGFDLVITDICMPRTSGLDALCGMRRADWAIPVIVMTAFGDDAIRAEARRLGAGAVFDKPFDIADLRLAALHLAGRPWRACG